MITERAILLPRQLRVQPERHAILRNCFACKRTPSLVLTVVLFIIPGVFLSLAMVPLPSPQQQATESQVKSAYLFNFGKFVHWQARTQAPAGPFAICVIGKDPLGTDLDETVEGESIEGQKIAVRRIPSAEAAADCRILFISSSEDRRLAPILAAAEHFEILTVSDMTEFVERGGAIGFVMQGDRIRFEVNQRAAERAHLKMSSELLKIAVRVIDKEAPAS